MPEQPVPRIAWFTPLPPVKSGISLYSEELLPLISRVVPTDVFVDGYAPEGIAPSDALHILPARKFLALDRQRRYDAVVYQMGNSPAHAYMYPFALRRPGVLVLHDTMLHHLVLSMLLRGRGVKQYRARMTARYGEAGAAAAERVLRGQSPISLFDFPLSEDLIEGSQVVVVHSDFSRQQVLGRHPEATVERVPMGITLPPSIERSTARAALGWPDDLFVVASITLVNPYKRLDVVMRALRRLRQTIPVRFVVAGEVSPAVPLERMLALYGLSDVSEVRGYVPHHEAMLIAAAANVSVNLRYPTAGETSASLLRIMAAGRPVFVSDAGSFSEMPDDAVVKVPVDALEDETAYALLEALWSQPGLAAQLGRNARRFIEQEHSLAVVADGYRRVLERVIQRSLPAPHVTPVNDPWLPGEETFVQTSPLLDDVALGIVELGLGNDRRLQQSVAEAAVDLGLGVGKIADDEPNQNAEEGRGLSSQDAKPISDELLAILACPVCKTPVRLEGEKLVCDTCGRRYRIDDGIPIMLIDEAEMPKAG